MLEESLNSQSMYSASVILFTDTAFYFSVYVLTHGIAYYWTRVNYFPDHMSITI